VIIANLIRSTWRPTTDGGATLPVYNPATGEVIGQVPLSGGKDVDAAVKAAAVAYRSWSRTAVMERTRLMFRFKSLLEDHVEDLAAIITRHHGKTLDESRGEVRRGIEVVDFACGAPTLTPRAGTMRKSMSYKGSGGGSLRPRSWLSPDH
jgi:malonate-semialdehyde dehydrogenase (acetylating) / methylmalonate-semialdehyde dehydrogenase